MITLKRSQQLKDIITQLFAYCISLRKQRALVADPEAIQQINFTPFLDQKENTGMFFIIEEAKEPFQIFHKKLLNCSNFILF